MGVVHVRDWAASFSNKAMKTRAGEPGSGSSRDQVGRTREFNHQKGNKGDGNGQILATPSVLKECG